MENIEKVLENYSKFKLNPDSVYVAKINKGLESKDGHCPCQIGKTEDNKCPCIKFRINEECCCKLFILK